MVFDLEWPFIHVVTMSSMHQPDAYMMNKLIIDADIIWSREVVLSFKSRACKFLSHLICMYSVNMKPPEMLVP